MTDKDLSSAQKIAELLNLAPSAETPPTPKPIAVASPVKSIVPVSKPVNDPTKPDVEQDYDEVRENIKSLIATGKVAIDSLMEVAMESDEPRHYEVVADLVKTAIDANMKLIELHKQRKIINKEDTDKKVKVVPKNETNNYLTVTSTSDLLKMIKGKKTTEEIQENGDSTESTSVFDVETQ